MRTHVRALAAIVEHASKTGDEQGAFALGVKLCNLRAAAKWGIEHYQRRIQVACRLCAQSLHSCGSCRPTQSDASIYL